MKTNDKRKSIATKKRKSIATKNKKSWVDWVGAAVKRTKKASVEGAMDALLGLTRDPTAAFIVGQRDMAAWYETALDGPAPGAAKAGAR